jgi:hypothetical protein
MANNRFFEKLNRALLEATPVGSLPSPAQFLAFFNAIAASADKAGAVTALDKVLVMEPGQLANIIPQVEHLGSFDAFRNMIQTSQNLMKVAETAKRLYGVDGVPDEILKALVMKSSGRYVLLLHNSVSDEDMADLPNDNDWERFASGDVESLVDKIVNYDRVANSAVSTDDILVAHQAELKSLANGAVDAVYIRTPDTIWCIAGEGGPLFDIYQTEPVEYDESGDYFSQSRDSGGH